MTIQPPEPYDFIEAIYAEKYQYPLYDDKNNPVQYFFSQTESLVWKAAGDESEPEQVVPIALSPRIGLRVALAKGVAERLQKECAEPIHLTGSYNGITVFQCGDLLSGDLVHMTTPTKNGTPKPLPLALTNKINWCLTDKRNAAARYKTETASKMYIFPENLPKYYEDVGISLPLLAYDHFLPRWMTLSAKEAKDLTWPVFVIESMFNQCKYQYETYSGASKYVSSSASQATCKGTFQAREGLNFWIDLFTSDISSISGRHQLNCFDITAVCQAYIALGVDQSTATIRMIYLEPYGYIKRTSIIGCFESDPVKLFKNPSVECNNPFYMNTGYDPDMLCKENSPLRSKLDGHVFLSVKEGGISRILDACIGPHRGTDDLNAYIEASIDSNPDLYADSSAESVSRPGKPSDAQRGTGIENLVTSHACRERTGNYSGWKLTLHNLAEDLVESGEPGQWSAPFLTSPLKQRRFTATWTVTRHDKKDVYWINLFKYINLDDLQQAFARRTENTRGYTVRPGKTQEGFTDDATGAVIIWYDEERRYMATIQSKRGKGISERVFSPPPQAIPALAIFKDRFEVALNSRLDSSRPARDAIQR